MHHGKHRTEHNKMISKSQWEEEDSTGRMDECTHAREHVCNRAGDLDAEQPCDAQEEPEYTGDDASPEEGLALDGAAVHDQLEKERVFPVQDDEGGDHGC